MDDVPRQTLIDPAQLFSDWIIAGSSLSVPFNTPTRIANANVRRVGLIFSPTAATDYWWWTDGTISSTNGIFVRGSSVDQKVQLTYSIHGSLVQGDIWVFYTGAFPFTFSMLETIWQPH